MRTDASGHGEHASSDSFYDSDNTEAEAAPNPQSVIKPTPAQGLKKKENIVLKKLY